MPRAFSANARDVVSGGSGSSSSLEQGALEIFQQRFLVGKRRFLESKMCPKREYLNTFRFGEVETRRTATAGYFHFFAVS